MHFYETFSNKEKAGVKLIFIKFGGEKKPSNIMQAFLLVTQILFWLVICYNEHVKQ